MFMFISFICVFASECIVLHLLSNLIYIDYKFIEHSKLIKGEQAQILSYHPHLQYSL